MSKNRYKSYKLLIVLTFFMFFVGYKLGYADTLDCPVEEVSACPDYPCTAGYIQDILGMVKIFIPILLILLGTIDFVKAIVAQNDEKIKQAQSDFVKRLIIGITIFFVPMILSFILNVAGFGNTCLDALIRF